MSAASAQAMALQLWQVFSVDFTRYPIDWSVLACVALGLGDAAIGIAFITNLVNA